MGKDIGGRTQYGGITAPGNAPWVLTVGASSHMGTVDRADDTIARFSSRGPTAIDRHAKPDLLAPGVGVESLSSPGSTLFNTKSGLLLSGTVAAAGLPYLSLSGTSQAAPIVAGTVALMLQANPALTPNAIKAILQFTAEARPEYDALTQGAGFANALGAVELARYLAAPDGSAYPTATDWGGHLIWGNYRVRGGLLSADASGWRKGRRWGAWPTASTPVDWGILCPQAECPAAPDWSAWGAACLEPTCSVVSWGGQPAENVVWGYTCGGLNCPPSLPYITAEQSGTTSSASDTPVEDAADSGETVVWGTSDSGDTVVWGTADSGDTVVWGTADDSGDTVVWGTSDGDTV